MIPPRLFSAFVFFFFNHTATTEIYTLSLHDALPISSSATSRGMPPSTAMASPRCPRRFSTRSEEHTSELQSLRHLVCRLLLEKKKSSVKKSILTKTDGRLHCTEVYIISLTFESTVKW